MSRYVLGGEAQIQDRVEQWSGFSDEELRAIMAEGSGTERYEAARRILATRGSATTVVPTGSVTLKVPTSLSPQVQVSPGPFDFKNPLVLGAIGVGAALLGVMLTGRR